MKHIVVLAKQRPKPADEWDDFCYGNRALLDLYAFKGAQSPIKLFIDDRCFN